MPNREIADLRKSYQKGALLEENLLKDPIEQFRLWFKEAQDRNISEPNAMILATATPDGFPSARTVLLKGIEEDGFLFYTNYESRKGQEIASNPNIALAFLWKEMERQIRIEGKADKISQEASTRYFQSRPRDSQIGAWTSPQSTILSDRQWLDDQKSVIEKKFESEEDIPLPPFWGGYKVVPSMIEFWQGRRSRLHDRLQYTRTGSDWHVTRLAP